MINEALNFIKNQINDHLDLQNGNAVGEKLIVLSNVALGSGDWAIPPQKMGISLINVEEEKVFKDQQTQFKNSEGQYQQYNPELKLNLYVLVCSNYVNDPQIADDTKYEQGLKQLSSVIGLFQGKNVFTPQNTPAMANPEYKSLNKLIVELYSYSFEQQFNFWSILGAKYLPSVLYKVRLLAFQEKEVQSQNEPITNITIHTSDK
jgi:Pvc16 N-terminal domain